MLADRAARQKNPSFLADLKPARLPILRPLREVQAALYRLMRPTSSAFVPQEKADRLLAASWWEISNDRQSVLSALNRTLAMRAKGEGARVLLKGCFTPDIIILVHPAPELQSGIVEFLSKDAALRHAPVLALASKEYPLVLPELVKRSSLLQYSVSGELPSLVHLNTVRVHFMGGWAEWCLTRATKDSIAQLLLHSSDKSRLDIVWHLDHMTVTQTVEPHKLPALARRLGNAATVSDETLRACAILGSFADGLLNIPNVRLQSAPFVFDSVEPLACLPCVDPRSGREIHIRMKGTSF